MSDDYPFPTPYSSVRRASGIDVWAGALSQGPRGGCAFLSFRVFFKNAWRHIISILTLEYTFRLNSDTYICTFLAKLKMEARERNPATGTLFP